MYLHDELSPYRALAIDLGSLGFAIWQQYVDVVQMLRALFTLATSTRKETITVHNVGQLARSAVLHIATANTPLFMTTLSMDILQPRNVQHRKSIMQLVVFLIRKVGNHPTDTTISDDVYCRNRSFYIATFHDLSRQW